MELSVGTEALCVSREGEVECTGDSSGLCPSDGVKELPGVEQISAGDGFTCALQSGGAVSCWGEFFGPGDEGGCVDPRLVEELEGAAMIASGYDNVCGLMEDGIRCVNRRARQEPLSIDGDFTSIWRGAHQRDPISGSGNQGETICGVSRAGRARCVGALSWAPTDLKGVVEVALGQGFACALRAEGEVMCWGDNGRGQLGDSGQLQVEDPVTFALGD